MNSTIFQPGTCILFKSGTVCTGTLSPKGSGERGNPIVIDQYGTGGKPVIAGNGGEGIESLEGYRLRENSPAVGSGMILPDNGGKDFRGTTVPRNTAPDRGAYQHLTDSGFPE